MGKGKGKIPSTGIYIISGIPGSGKSYCAVEAVVEEVLRGDRLVYTNLPIRWKSMQAYLYVRGRGDLKLSREAAKLLALRVRPLRRGHFVAFCERLAAIDDRADELMRGEGGSSLLDAPAFEERAARNEARKQIAGERGEEVVTGKGANWIPPVSVLVLDELHKWFPNASQGKEPAEILKYTSMHRHMMHKVYVLTQRAMNVSLSFRSNAVEYWTVRNMRTVKLFWFFRFPMLIFNRVKYGSSDIEKGNVRIGAEALERDTIIPRFSGFVTFKLYDSYSHVMSLEEATEEVRLLMADFKRVSERRRPMKMPESGFDRVMGAINRRVWRVVSWPFRHWKLGLVGCVLLWIVYGAGGGGREEVVSAEMSSAGVVEGGKSVAGEWAAGIAVKPMGPKIGSMFPGGVMVDGQMVRKGESYEAAKLLAVDVKTGHTIWMLTDEWGFVVDSAGVLDPFRVVYEGTGVRIESASGEVLASGDK